MSHSSLLDNVRGEENYKNVNFCELFSCELFGTFVGSIYICIGLVVFVSKAFLRFTNEVRPGSV